MINRTAATLLTCLLAFTILFQQVVFASSKSEKDASVAHKVKAGIVKLGVGQLSRVSLKLKDKRKVAGYISEISEDSFIVASLESGERTTVAYPDVVQVKGSSALLVKGSYTSSSFPFLQLPCRLISV